MPFAKSVQRVIGGGLDYRTRQTDISDDGAQKMTNCAFDQNGSIRSRKGHTTVWSAAGRVLQMIRGLGTRWAASAASVDKQGQNGVIAVASAHIVAFKKYIWAANGAMRKSNGTSDWDWIPAPPTNAPTIRANDEVINVIDNFSGGWMEDTNVDTGDPDSEEEDEDIFDEHGLFIQGDDDTVKSFSKSVHFDIYTGFSGDEIFKIKLRAKKWSNISGVTFEVDVGNGTFQDNYYRCRMALKDIKAGRKETITIYITKRPRAIDVQANDKFKWGVFERIGAATDRDWRSVVKLRVKVEFRLATRFWFTNWAMVGDEDNQLEGDDFGVYYTRTTLDGHESNPSPKSKLVNCKRSSIRVEGLQRGGDPQVTGLNVYLTGGTLGAVYKANGAKLDPDTGDPVDGDGPITATTYDITASEDDLTNLNIQMEDDHDTPPAAEGIAGPYFGRIIAWKGSRFYWTHQNKPFAFANPDGPDGDWADVDDNAGKIKHISIRPHQAWIYSENEIFVLVGDPADAIGEVHPTGTKMGTPSRNGVAQAGPADFAYLGNGIYVTDASGAPTKISEELDPIFQGRSVRLWDGSIVQPISDPSSVALGYEDGILRVSHADGTFNYNTRMRRWVGDSRRFSAFQAESESGVLGGQNDGRIVQLESGNSDDGAPIRVDFLSKAYDCGAVDNEKKINDLTTFHALGGASFTQTVYIAEGAGLSTTITSNTTRERTVQVTELTNVPGDGVRAREVAVGLVGDTQAEAFIDDIAINYYPEAREAKTYDTAVTDAGTHHVKLIRELQLDMENENAVTVTLETDLPAFGLGPIEQHAVANRPFRRTEPIVMTDERYGHDFRVLASGAGYFHLFGARALVQSIGTYLHGGYDEYYLSDPVDWGSERVKLAREVQLTYRSIGEATLEVYSDLPSGEMALMDGGTFVLFRHLQEGHEKARLRGTARGRQFQIRIIPQANDFRLEAARILLKRIGEPSATPWTWVDFPVAKTTDAIWVDLPLQPDAVG